MRLYTAIIKITRKHFIVALLLIVSSLNNIIFIQWLILVFFLVLQDWTTMRILLFYTWTATCTPDTCSCNSSNSSSRRPATDAVLDEVNNLWKTSFENCIFFIILRKYCILIVKARIPEAIWRRRDGTNFKGQPR